jgi:hypothetical protein
MRERVITLDLHTHALEKGMKIDDYLREVKKKGIDVIGVTEHVEFNPEKAFKKVKKKNPKEVVLIPGAELNTEIGHVLIYADSERLYQFDELFQKQVPFEDVMTVADKEGFMVSISHPWGFSYDSAAYIVGEKRLHELVERYHVGIEAYNGMIGTIGSSVLDSKLINKPLGLFNYLDKNRLAKATGVNRLTNRLKKTLDHKTFELVTRCAKPIELGERAAFVTAGSDAHSAKRVGSGIMKIKTTVSPANLNARTVLNEIKHGKVIWTGPYVEEVSPGVYKKPKEAFSKKEMAQGIRYAASSIVKKSRKGVQTKLTGFVKDKVGRGKAEKG